MIDLGNGYYMDGPGAPILYRGSSDNSSGTSPIEKGERGTNASDYGWADVVSGAADTMATQSAFSAEQAAKERSFNAEQAALANEFSSAEAQKSRDWQEYMSNTSYQRQMADMKAAGINPLNAMSALSSGASTPSGANASGKAASGSGKAVAGSSNGATQGLLGFIGGLIKTVAAVATTSGKVAAVKDVAQDKIESDFAKTQAVLENKTLNAREKNATLARIAKDRDNNYKTIAQDQINAASARQAQRQNFILDREHDNVDVTEYKRNGVLKYKAPRWFDLDR